MNKHATDNSISGDEKIACRRCGVCCTRHQAYVREEDIARITAFLGIRRDDWQKLYEDPRWEFDNIRLIRHGNGGCAFLRYEGSIAICTIHDVRPACCAEWQPGPDRKECREGMKKVIT